MSEQRRLELQNLLPARVKVMLHADIWERIKQDIANLPLAQAQ